MCDRPHIDKRLLHGFFTFKSVAIEDMYQSFPPFCIGALANARNLCIERVQDPQ